MQTRATVGVSLVLTLVACAGSTSGSGHETDGGMNTGSGESGGETSTSSDSDGTGTQTGDETGDETGWMGTGKDDAFVPTECDIWAPECGEGRKCTAYATMGSSWDDNKCVDVMGDAAPGEPCMGFGDSPGVSGLDDCEAGSMCWDIDPNIGLGYCVAFCAGSAEDAVCPDATLCAIYNNGVLPLCLFECDPIDPQCPNPMNACISDPGGNGFVCVLHTDSMGGYGDDCTYAASCDQGLFCATKAAVPGCMTPACCSEFCDTALPNTCAGKDQGQQCVPWYDEGEAPEGYETVGGCVIP